MRRGEPFEVSKEVFDRARAQHLANGNKDNGIYYMTNEDKQKLFDISILCGYGLYGCQVYETDGKYMCRYETGSSCD